MLLGCWIAPKLRFHHSKKLEKLPNIGINIFKQVFELQGCSIFQCGAEFQLHVIRMFKKYFKNRITRACSWDQHNRHPNQYLHAKEITITYTLQFLKSIFLERCENCFREMHAESYMQWYGARDPEMKICLAVMKPCQEKGGEMALQSLLYHFYST